MNDAINILTKDKRCVYMETHKPLTHHVLDEDLRKYKELRRTVPEHIRLWETAYERNMYVLGRPCIAEHD